MEMEEREKKWEELKKKGVAPSRPLWTQRHCSQDQTLESRLQKNTNLPCPVAGSSSRCSVSSPADPNYPGHWEPGSAGALTKQPATGHGELGGWNHQRDAGSSGRSGRRRDTGNLGAPTTREFGRGRDTYQREKKRESSEKRSGSAAQSSKKWKYSAVLSFLDPCITPRETSGNMGRRAVEVRTAESREEERA
ncbi:hypothetical protein EYF80_031633 [Liparis tanakae]|uniref:Uncharacterized protein n=1 Tax=Liparis tanakae TaxID=230148 RepID=A0A4Z2GXX0_9TELE|nr:hypothetical protein EYF80_031633 [Liparis tanakae]